ncbi:hypothetical protein Q9233_006847, partial [Columba guinea]
RQARELQRLRELIRRQRAVQIRQLLRSKEAELRQAQGMLQQQRGNAVREARELQRQLAKELSALKDLERRCGVLQGNGLLGKASCPQVRGEVDGLKQKAAKLALISKQLEERARQLREAIAHLGTPGCRQP